MNKLLFVLLICLYPLLGYSQKKIMVNSNVLGRTYEGMGSLSAGASSRLLIDYPEPQRSQILDYLFKPKYGASLNHLKTEIGGDVNSTCGTESSFQHVRGEKNFNRGYEWWLMKEAKKRNPEIILDVLAWGAPYWIGNGKYYSEDLPHYMADYLIGAKEVHGLDIDYIGIWNERPYNVEYIKSLRATLDSCNISTRIAAADEIRSYYICRDILKDPKLYNAVDVVGTHYPHGQGAELYNGKTVYQQYGKDYRIVWKEALECGKPIWSLEDGPWAEDWNGAKGLIKVLIRNYIEAKMVKTISWSLISSYHDNIAIGASGLMKANTPWSGHYILKPALWTMAHFTQFAEPGWIFLEGGANGYLDNGGSYVSLLSPNKKDVSIIVETVESTEDEVIHLNLLGEYSEKDFYVWESDSINQFVKQKQKLNAINGVLCFNANKGKIYTLTTTVGQRKGDASIEIPQVAKFKLPYKDNFDKYEVDKLPKYTSDIAGVFETAQFEGNTVLKQVVPAKGIEWAASLNPEPFTIIGDTSLSNYTISLDVRLENDKEHVYVMGRIPYIAQGQVVPPMGYWLKISTSGKYTLCSTLPSVKNGWISSVDKWENERKYFKDDTSNSRIIDLAELKTWPEEKIKLFDGLYDIMNNTSNDPTQTIVLVVYSNNSYQIYPLKQLSSGEVRFPKKEWNNVKLSFKKDQISAMVNKRQIFKVKDNQYTNGFAGFGTGWHYGMFDNLSIK